ncbi:hypothetical protein A6R70_08415 [Agrobacterium rubi]|nr:hypothetical protein [Agrobacterium rubi]
MLLLVAAVFMFAAGSCVYDIISLPVPAPSNTVSFLSALLHSAVFSFHSIVILNSLIYFGRLFDAPPIKPEREKWDFPGWILEQPFFGIFLGLFLFSSPFLIAIGLSGVAYLLAVGLVLYLTPRLMAKGYLGYGLLSALCLAAGFILAALITRTPDTSMCVDDKVVPLRSGAAVPCDVYSFVDKVDGMIIKHGQSSIFVPLKDLAPHEITALGPGSWLIRGEIRPID